MRIVKLIQGTQDAGVVIVLEGIERSSGIDVADAIIHYLERTARPGRSRDRVGR